MVWISSRSCLKKFETMGCRCISLPNNGKARDAYCLQMFYFHLVACIYEKGSDSFLLHITIFPIFSCSVVTSLYDKRK